jgi:ribosomal protein S14
MLEHATLGPARRAHRCRHCSAPRESSWPDRFEICRQLVRFDVALMA